MFAMIVLGEKPIKKLVKIIETSQGIELSANYDISETQIKKMIYGNKKKKTA